MKATADETKQWCVGNGIVSKSLGFRFLLSSIFLVKPMPCPYSVCSSWDEAMTWVQQSAATRGLGRPARAQSVERLRRSLRHLVACPCAPARPLDSACSQSRLM